MAKDEHDPGSYDLEELIHIGRLENELFDVLQQILSLDPNAVVRIERIKARAFSAISSTPSQIPEPNVPDPNPGVLH